jgi:hypothetical protein
MRILTKIRELNERLNEKWYERDSLQKEYDSITCDLNDCYLLIHQKLIKNRFYENMRISANFYNNETIPVGYNVGLIISEIFDINSENLPVTLGDIDYSEIKISYEQNDETIHIDYYNSWHKTEVNLCVLNLNLFENDEKLFNYLEKYVYPQNRDMFMDGIKMAKIYRRNIIKKEIEKLQKELNELN